MLNSFRLGFRCSASHSIREGKGREGMGWKYLVGARRLVAGEETKESLSTWPSAAVAQQSSGSERVARERDRRREGGRGKRTEGEADGGKKNAREFVFFFSLSHLIFYSC